MFPSFNSSQRVSDSKNSLGIAPQRRLREKVVLQPGHSPLDWATLTSKTPRHVLRGVGPEVPPPAFVSIPKSELRKHDKKDDCWMVINGKVFNVTPYINFHPGGAEQLLRCAGKDGTALFNKYHSWVNPDRLLDHCLIGQLSNER